jgi:chromosome segregation ATPase
MENYESDGKNRIQSLKNQLLQDNNHHLQERVIQLERIEQQFQKLHSQILVKDEIIAQLTLTLNQKQFEMDFRQSQIDRLQKDIISMKDENEYLTQFKYRITKENEIFQREIEVYKLKIPKNKTKTKMRQKQLLEKDQEISQLKINYEVQLAEQHQQIQEFKKKETLIQKEIDKLHQEKEFFEKEKKLLFNSRNIFNDEIQKMEVQNSNLLIQNNQLEQQMKDSQENFQTEISQLKYVIESFESELDDNQKNYLLKETQLSNQFNEFSQKSQNLINQLNLKIHDQAQTIDYLLSQLKHEDYKQEHFINLEHEQHSSGQILSRQLSNNNEEIQNQLNDLKVQEIYLKTELKVIENEINDHQSHQKIKRIDNMREGNVQNEESLQNIVSNKYSQAHDI